MRLGRRVAVDHPDRPGVWGLWLIVYGLWFTVYEVWFMVYGLWFMVYVEWIGAGGLRFRDQG